MLTTQLHTILLYVGPSNCGKTTYAKKVLIPSLKRKLVGAGVKPRVGYVSSDDIRRELLCHDISGSDYDKYSDNMMSVSVSAFDILFTKLNGMTSFPANNHFVIVDTTGLGRDFRLKVEEIAKKNNYNIDVVIFKYNVKDHYKYGGNKDIIHKHLSRLNNDVIRNIGISYSNRHTISEYVDINKADEYDVNIMDLDLYKRCYYTENKYVIIGDVHCCIDELQMLILKVGFNIIDDVITRTAKTEKTVLLLIGDIIDKGDDMKLRDMIDFIHKNMDSGCLKMIRGNHETKVYDLITTDQDCSKRAEFFRRCFGSYYYFSDHMDYAQKFLEIYEKMLPFVEYQGPGKKFYASHAICENRYIGKLDDESIHNQNYIRAWGLDAKKIVNSIAERSENIYPVHVSGHIAIKSIYKGYMHNNNKILIDTGCIHGNRLSCVIVGEGIKVPKYMSVSFDHKQKCMTETLTNLNNVVVDDEMILQKYTSLPLNEKKRIDRIVSNRVNYISGTICPAPANEKDGDFESIKEALLYYYREFRRFSLDYRVVLQPKYMGSRCNIYLFLDVDKCYCVSRNGHVIMPTKTFTKVDMIRIYSKHIDQFREYMTHESIKCIILDGELMPWNALGNGLIDNCFKTIDLSMKTELDVLKEAGFEGKYEEMVKEWKESDFKIGSMSNKELKKKFGAKYYTYKVLVENEDSHVSVDDKLELHDNYHRQVELYGSFDHPYYKPFGILKFVMDDGTESIPGVHGLNTTMSQIDIFKLVSKDRMIVIDFTAPFEGELERAMKYFHRLTESQLMEGIVIKPEYQHRSIAPAMKVRNDKYLSIIYGYDYDIKHPELVKSKYIGKKRELSISEFNSGINMLEFPYSDIENNEINTQFIGSMMTFLKYEKDEKYVDPRL